MSLLIKLSIISTSFLLLAIVIFSVISVRSVKSSSMETAVIMGNGKLVDDMMHLEDMINNEYGKLNIEEGELVGQQGVSLHYQYGLVDKLGDGKGIVATIFIREGIDYRRINTSIIDDAGKRAVDTFLGTGSAAYSSIQSGLDYSGSAVILGKDYLTLYRPIFAQNERDVIGILFIGIEMLRIEKIISQNTVKEIILIIIIAVIILLALIIVNAISLNLILIKPIKIVTSIIRRLSIGDLNLQIEETKSMDEIGTMTKELNNLFEGLKRTAGFAQDIGNGNLNALYQPLSNDDLLGNSLLDMRQSLQNAQKTQSLHANDERQRNWVNEGIAKFADILRRDNADMEALSYNIIKNMVRYLNANQGSIFIMNETEDENEKFLELKGCYAFDRKKFEIKQIRPGEGLVGACYLEGKTIYMTNVPDNYINITSGLGDANPKAILISPLKVNDEIFGIIELASFEKFESHQLEFIQKVSESIASTISSVKVNLRTTHLLERTKMQAEELANAEEELRQSMEEMQATQEEMRRREVELHETIANMKAQHNIIED